MLASFFINTYVAWSVFYFQPKKTFSLSYIRYKTHATHSSTDTAALYSA